MALGVPELVIVLLGMLFWVVPVAAAVWAILTLHRFRQTQVEMQQQLATLVQRDRRD